MIPALGGPTIQKIAAGAVGDPLCWSPDGKWLVWDRLVEPNSVRRAIHAAPAAGGKDRQLVDTAPGGGSGDSDAAISPDGRHLVFCRCLDDYDCDLDMTGFLDGRTTGALERLTHDHWVKSNPRWMGDGKEIVYIAGETTSERGIFRVRPGDEPRRVEGIGQNADYLVLSPSGRRLLYSTAYTNYDTRRVDLKANDPDATAERFLSSTRYDVSPAYSPDGKRIAFSSNRGGVRQIWVADADGSNPSVLTSFQDGIASSPKSPDGRFIAFDARPAPTRTSTSSPRTEVRRDG